MKKLTKVLSLVLVIAMVVSLCVVGASAKTFTDYKPADKAADYTEAVDVMSGVGIIEGMPSGNFEAAGNFNRAQAAKIIAYMQLGPAKAEALTFSANTAVVFKDVPTSFWAYKYIEYCAQQGIISGYGNGKFGPNDTLTGYQWAKMLLSAVGYGVNKEYNGANWAVNAARDGLKYGVFSAYADVLSGSTPNTITRDVATAMAFNTLVGIPKVTYSALVGDYIDSTGAAWNVALLSGVTTKGTLGWTVFKLQNTANYEYNYGTNAKYVGESPLVYSNDAFVVEYAPEFTPNNVDYTMVGRVGHAWYVLNNYNRPVAVSNFYTTDALLGSSHDGSTFTELTTKGSGTYIAPKDTTVSFYTNGKFVGYSAPAAPDFRKGADVQLFDTNGNGKVDTVLYFPKTLGVVGANGVAYNTAKTKATVASIVDAYTSVDALDNFAGLVAGDVTLYWQDVTGVTHFQKLTADKNQLSKVSFLKNARNLTEISYTIGGKDGYTVSGLKNASTDAEVQAEGYNVDVNYYYDDFGYIVYAKAVGTPLSAFVVLLDLGTDFNATVFTKSAAYAQLLNMDGTVTSVPVASITTAVDAKGVPTASVKVGPDATNKDKDLVTLTSTTATAAGPEAQYEDVFYTYTTNPQGQYILTPVQLSTGDTYRQANAASTGRAIQTNDVQTGYSDTKVGGTTVALANASTVYLYLDDATGKYVVVNGYATVPSSVAVDANGVGTSDIAVAYAKTGTVAKYVFMKGTVNTTVAANAVFFTNPDYYVHHGAAGSVPAYNEYQVIDTTGALTTVNVAVGQTPVEGFNTPTYITYGTTKVAKTVTRLTPPVTQYGIASGATDSSYQITVGGSEDETAAVVNGQNVKPVEGYTWTASTAVFVVNKDSTTHIASLDTAVKAVTDIKADVNDHVYVVPTSASTPNVAKAIYIVKVEDPSVKINAVGNIYYAVDAAAAANVITAPTSPNCVPTYAWFLNDVAVGSEQSYTPNKVLTGSDKLVCKVTFTQTKTGATYTAQTDKVNTAVATQNFNANSILTVNANGVVTLAAAPITTCTATVSISMVNAQGTYTDIGTQTVEGVSTTVITLSSVHLNLNNTYRVVVTLTAPGYNSQTITFNGSPVSA